MSRFLIHMEMYALKQVSCPQLVKSAEKGLCSEKPNLAGRQRKVEANACRQFRAV